MRLAWQIATVAALTLAAGGIWYAAAGRQDTAQQSGPQIRPTAVVAAAATTGDIPVTFDAIGTLRANEAVTVTSKLTGIVSKISFTEGQRVKTGDVLVELDATEAKAELAVAESQRRTVAQELERAIALLGRQAVAQARVDDLRVELQGAEARFNAARARLQDLTIRAPFAGVAGLRRVSPGALVRPGDPVTTVDDIGTVKLDFSVPEAALRRLAVGQSIAARTAVFPDRAFTGVIGAVDTRVDPVTRTLTLVAEIPNEDFLLKPGLFMNVRLLLDERKGVVLIPEESLVPVGDRQYVFAVKNGRVERRLVVIGARQSGVVEAVEGVAEGELVITRGTQKVREGSPVAAEIVPMRLPGPAGTQS